MKALFWLVGESRLYAQESLFALKSVFKEFLSFLERPIHKLLVRLFCIAVLARHARSHTVSRVGALEDNFLLQLSKAHLVDFLRELIKVLLRRLLRRQLAVINIDHFFLLVILQLRTLVLNLRQCSLINVLDLQDVGEVIVKVSCSFLDRVGQGHVKIV